MEIIDLGGKKSIDLLPQNSLTLVASVMAVLVPAAPAMAALKASGGDAFGHGRGHHGRINRVQLSHLAEEQCNSTTAIAPSRACEGPGSTQQRVEEGAVHRCWSVFSTSEHGTCPSPRERTPVPSLKLASKGRG